MLELDYIFSNDMVLQGERKTIGFVVVSGGFLRVADGKIVYIDENHSGKSIADVSEKHLI